MKERASFTFDKETLEILDKLVQSGSYRNRSHAVEYAIKCLIPKSLSDEKEVKKDQENL